METPLADNPDHVFALCSLLSLGEPNTTVTRVTGGLHHRMWRLETSKEGEERERAHRKMARSAGGGKFEYCKSES